MGALEALSKAFAQLRDPAFRRVLWRGVGIAAAIYALALLAIYAGFQWMPAAEGWLGTTLMAFGAIAAFALVTVLFPTLITACMGLFLDDVAAAVERRHYPHLPPGREPPMATQATQAIKFLALSLTLNLLALPLYAVGLFFYPFKLFVFYALNGYLLGREYFDQVAQRHHAPAERRQLRGALRLRRILAGLAIAVLFSIPVLNLAVPLVATAAMVHLILGAAGKRVGGASAAAVEEHQHVQSGQEG
jgi:CysZ protein